MNTYAEEKAGSTYRDLRKKIEKSSYESYPGLEFQGWELENVEDDNEIIDVGAQEARGIVEAKAVYDKVLVMGSYNLLMLLYECNKRC